MDSNKEIERRWNPPLRQSDVAARGDDDPVGQTMPPQNLSCTRAHGRKQATQGKS